MIYADPRDAKKDFEKAKRKGAQSELADTMKDCKAAGKSKADCDADAEDTFADSMGLDKADSVDFKAKYQRFKKDAAASAAVATTSACKEEAGTDAAKLGECRDLAKKEAADALGEAKDYTAMDNTEK